jgi:hypothetical protein
MDQVSSNFTSSSSMLVACKTTDEKSSRGFRRHPSSVDNGKMYSHVLVCTLAFQAVMGSFSCSRVDQN